MALGRLEHAERTAYIELAARIEPGDLARDVDALPLLVDEELNAVADATGKLVGQRQNATRARGIEHAEIRIALGQRQCHRVDRRDADAAGHEQIFAPAVA